MLKSLKIIKKTLSKIETKFVPSLYKKKFEYGSLSFKHSCSLTKKESLLFKCQEYIDNKIKIAEYVSEPSFAFRSFFDQSLGIMVDSAETKRQIEKDYNVTYISNYDRQQMTKEAKQNIKYDKQKKYRNASKQIIENVHRGHSYVNELKKRIS